MTLQPIPENAENRKRLGDLGDILGSQLERSPRGDRPQPPRGPALTKVEMPPAALPKAPAPKVETPAAAPAKASMPLALAPPAPATSRAKSLSADVEVRVTFGETYAGGKTQLVWPEAVKMPWPEFRERLLKHAIGPKHGGCFMPAALGLSEVRGEDGAMRTERRRCRAAVEAIYVFAVDLDAGKTSIGEAKARLEARGVEAVIYTTHSHTNEKPRFRVVIPLAKPWALSAFPHPTSARLTWKRFYLAAAAEFGFEIDESCTDLARLFYEGRHDEGEPFETSHVAGRPLDADFTPVADVACKRFDQSQKDLNGDPDILDEAMAALPNDGAFDARADYIEIALACFGAYEDKARGFEAFREWSERWAGGGLSDAPDADYDEATWDGIAETRLGALYIYRLAIEHSGGKFTRVMAEADPAYVRQRAEWTEGQSVAPGKFFDVIEDTALEAQERDAWAKRPPKFKALLGDDIAVVIAGQWIIKNLLPAYGLGVAFGAPGSGKTFETLDLALHVASPDFTGWRGRRVTSVNVAYVACEGGRVMQNRVSAWRMRHGAIGGFGLYPYATNLSKPDAATEERRVEVGDAGELCRSIEMQQGGVGLVVIDTLSRAMKGADENSGVDMGNFIAACEQIQKRLNCFVLIVHHCGKDAAKGSRGHSSLLAAVDLELEVKRVGAKSAERVMTVTKMRDGEDGAEFKFRLVKVDLGKDEDGEPVTTCVVETVDANVGAMSAEVAAVEDGALFVKLLKQRAAQGRPVSDSAGRNYAPFVLAQDPEAGQFMKERFGEAMERLLKCGRLKIDECGPPSKRRRILVPVEEPALSAPISDAESLPARATLQ